MAIPIPHDIASNLASAGPEKRLQTLRSVTDLFLKQADGLVEVIRDQLRALRGELRAMGVAPAPGSGEGPRTLAQLLLPDPSTLFGTAYSAFSLASGLLGNAVGLLVLAGARDSNLNLRAAFLEVANDALGSVAVLVAAAVVAVGAEDDGPSDVRGGDRLAARDRRVRRRSARAAVHRGGRRVDPHP